MPRPRGVKNKKTLALEELEKETKKFQKLRKEAEACTQMWKDRADQRQHEGYPVHSPMNSGLLPHLGRQFQSSVFHDYDRIPGGHAPQTPQNSMSYRSSTTAVSHSHGGSRGSSPEDQSSPLIQQRPSPRPKKGHPFSKDLNPNTSPNAGHDDLHHGRQPRDAISATDRTSGYNRKRGHPSSLGSELDAAANMGYDESQNGQGHRGSTKRLRQSQVSEADISAHIGHDDPRSSPLPHQSQGRPTPSKLPRPKKEIYSLQDSAELPHDDRGRPILHQRYDPDFATNLNRRQAISTISPFALYEPPNRQHRRSVLSSEHLGMEDIRFGEGEGDGDMDFRDDFNGGETGDAGFANADAYGDGSHNYNLGSPMETRQLGSTGGFKRPGAAIGRSANIRGLSTPSQNHIRSRGKWSGHRTGGQIGPTTTSSSEVDAFSPTPDSDFVRIAGAKFPGGQGHTADGKAAAPSTQGTHSIGNRAGREAVHPRLDTEGHQHVTSQLPTVSGLPGAQSTAQSRERARTRTASAPRSANASVKKATKPSNSSAQIKIPNLLPRTLSRSDPCTSQLTDSEMMNNAVAWLREESANIRNTAARELQETQDAWDETKKEQPLLPELGNETEKEREIVLQDHSDKLMRWSKEVQYMRSQRDEAVARQVDVESDIEGMENRHQAIEDLIRRFKSEPRFRYRPHIVRAYRGRGLGVIEQAEHDVSDGVLHQVSEMMEAEIPNTSVQAGAVDVQVFAPNGSSLEDSTQNTGEVSNTIPQDLSGADLIH